MNTAAFRRDIQGLRAVAVLLVLAYHLWPGTVTGGYVGVDAFFVISGFLITGHLLQHPPQRSRDLLEFWGRRIRRLLPAAFLVLLVTAVASRLLAPDTRWVATAQQIIASAFYVQNWALAANSVDYLAAAEAPTPVQHYWSLSVEEQFYIVWPILILGVFWLATRARLGPRSIGGWHPRAIGPTRSIALARLAMLAVIALSLYISIRATARDPASAYFVTQTRVWELAVGGLVATLPGLATTRLPRVLVAGLAWAGIAMVLIAGVAFSGDTAFPGFAALLPVGGTALAILAAATGPVAPARILGLRPIQHIGDTSYSIYLWHWPLIVLWPYAFGPIGPIGAVAIVATTFVLATLSKIYVEDRFRFAPSFQALVPTFRFAVVGMVVLSIVGAGQILETQARVGAAEASTSALTDTLGGDASAGGAVGAGATAAPGGSAVPGSGVGIASCVGAAAIVRGFAACPQDPAAQMIPDPLIAASDRPDAYRDNCWNSPPFDTRITCTYGTGSIRVALVGNSHAGQWLPALQILAKRDNWTITTFLASQCNATDASLEFDSAPKTTGCLGYGTWVMQQTSGRSFDLVISSERQSVRTLGDDINATLQTATAGYTSYLQRWVAAGTAVVVLQDTPDPGRTLTSIPDCLAQHESDETACGGTPDSWSWMDPLYAAATALHLPGLTTVPVTRFFCTAAVCPAVIGSVVTYSDASHMTATYARTIAPFVEAEIVDATAAR